MPLPAVLLFSLGLILSSVVALVSVVILTRQGETSACRTDAYAPFYADVGTALLDLDQAIADGEVGTGIHPISPSTRESMEASVADLNAIAAGDECV